MAGVGMYVYFNYRSPFKLHTVSYRNHRKIAVIDGRFGYTGGLNISQEHLDGGKHFSLWRDTHLRIEGEAVAALQAIFLTSWYNTTGERLATARYTAPLAVMAANYLPIHITISGPDSQWRAIRQLYFMMILSAEQHLYIQSPFFIPDEKAFWRRSKRLPCRALMCGSCVRPTARPTGCALLSRLNTYFEEMAQAGVRIFLYQKGYFHPKTVNVDGVICSVGTANMDIRSFSINYEVNAVIYDERISRQLAADFLQDQQDCLEFSLHEYERRHMLVRLRDSVARLFSPML